MLKFRSVLIVCLVVISLCSYAQRDSTLNHKNFVGVGVDLYYPLETIFGRWANFINRRSISANFGYKRSFRYFNLRLNLESIYQSSNWGWGGNPFTGVSLNPSFGLERRINPKAKLQVIYGIDFLGDIWVGLTFPGVVLDHIGVGPVVGVEYKLAKNIYVAHEMSVVYGPFLWDNFQGRALAWWGTNAHKIFDITVYYGF